MKKFSAAAMGIGLGVLGIAASRALLPQAPTAPAGASVNVTQHHNNASRDGLFIDPAFTFSAAANLARDVSFDGTIVGNVYAQPLYVEGGPDQRAKVIAVTESNNVYALDAITGAIIWQRNVGTPAGSMGLISPVGITGTPVIDLVSRSLFLIAVISGPNNMFYSLNVDTGAINPGFPIDVNATFPDFSSSLHMQRGALVLLGNMIYIPYGGYADIGNYQGRVLGISLDGTQFGEWVATSLKSGIWTPGGIASDGTNLYIATGNAPGGTTPWGGSEAIVRLQPGPVFSGSTTDYWAPTNWQSLDGGDVDLGGSNPIIVDVPGAIPSALVVAIGKDRNGYLIDRANLGGIIAPVNQAVVSSGQVINSPATYRTNQGTFVVLRPPNGTLTAFKITATNPPTIATGWTATATGRTSPFVTSTDGTNNTIVWAYGHGTNQRLFGYNGETGVQIFAGGGANDTISGTRTFTTGIAARGRIYIAGDNKVFAFSVPTGATPTPSPTPTASPTPTPLPTPSPTATSTTTPCASPTCGPSCFPKVQCVGPCICPPTPSPTPSATCAASPCPPGCFPVAQCACKCLTPTPSPTATPTTTPCPSPTCPPGCFPKVECVGPCICPTPTPTPTPCPACTPTPCPDCTPTPSPTPGGGTATPAPGEVHALNLSTRLLVGTGADVGIGGFIITGTGPRHILLRGIGPSLSGTGVNALSDPVLELHKSDGSTVTNNNWKDAQQQAIEDTGLAPTNDLESAILVDLDPGAYTAILKGNANVVGVGLVELYDLSMNTNSKLANTSTRANVSTGNNIVIAGFILGAGAGTDPIIVRGIGPSLSGVTALANPQLELRNSDGALIRSNNNWMDDPAQVVIIQAAGLAPSNALESAIAETLGPGGYTALLSGVNNGTGLGLVEVYDRPTTPPTPTASPSGTPSPTPSPSSTAGTPTPPPTPTPGPKPCTENFDGVTAPALPPGWVGVWVTTTTMPDSPPNAAFIPDQGGISDQVLDRMNVTVQSASATMTFRNNFNTDTSIGAADGGVLEVSVPSISGGDFLDVTDSHMGGTITAGGYTGVIGGLAGRMGWIGNSGGYINTVITLGPNMVGQTVTLRWHFITAGGHGAPGWWIDNLVFTDAVCP